MNCYLGYIELRRTFFNFHPLYVYDEGEKNFKALSKYALEGNFPEWGSLNLAYERFKDSYNFLKNLDVEELDNEIQSKRISTIYAVEFNNDDLEDSGDNKIKLKLDLQRLLDNGVKLEDRIYSASKYHIYKIATSKESISNESFSGNIFINETDYNAGDEVLLDYKRMLFGPYILQERPVDGEKYVRPDSGLHKYVLNYYSEDSYDFMSFEKEYFHSDSTYTDFALTTKEPAAYDVISDIILLTKLKDTVNFELLKTNPEEFKRLYATSPLLGDVSDEIRTHRNDRIIDILSKTQEFEENKSKALTTLIDSLGDKVFELLGDKIKDSKIYKDLKESSLDLQNDNERLKTNEYSLKMQIDDLKASIKEAEEKANATLDVTVNSEELNKLKVENAELKEKLDLVNDFERLTEDYKRLNDGYAQKKIEYDSKVREVDAKQAELEGIQSSLQTFIKDELTAADSTKMLKTAFDPYISNAMIEAASNYRSETETDCYKKIAEEMSVLKYDSVEKQTLINMLVDGVQKFRNYKKNDIINMYICLSQNFLTVFSGEPGTGKTSICNIIANSLGLNQFGSTEKGVSKNRFVPVSVERGWSSKRDLIGYFNPLTKKYDRNNAKIYDGLMILNYERKSSRFPYIILLDEANLSPMEYYWADFMRAADKSESDIFINIGLDEDIFIPNTLHFLATINNDQTTEQLSPRLIDRAWIIKLPKTEILETTERIENCFSSIVSWEDIEKTFVISTSKEMSLKDLAEQIYKLFDDHRLSVSPRIQQSIKNYVCVAQEIMEDELGVCSKKEKALDFAIVQKLLPKINGYYKDYERLFAALIQICDDNNLRMTKEALIAMQEFQSQNMGYCQYLV